MPQQLFFDRVMETSTSTGTAGFVVNGAKPGYRTFASVLSATNQFFYCIYGQSSTSWETGIGTFNGGNSLTRTQVLASSNSNALVNWGVETKDVFLTVAALFNTTRHKRHGIMSANAASVLGTTLTLPVGSDGNVSYFYQGGFFSTTSSVTLSTGTLSQDLLYYVQFTDSNGTITISTTPYDLYNVIPVCLLYKSSATGVVAVSNELHSCDIDVPWHVYAHNCFHSQYSSGLTLSGLTGTGAAAQWAVSGGACFDEDLKNAISASTQGSPGARVWYQNGAATYTFQDTAYPFLWNSGTTQAQYINAGFTKTDLTNAQYVNMWLYAAPDTIRPLYFITQSIAAPYSSAANARLEVPPNLNAFGLNPELVLLWRIVVKGDGTYVAGIAADDYRVTPVRYPTA